MNVHSSPNIWNSRMYMDERKNNFLTTLIKCIIRQHKNYRIFYIFWISSPFQQILHFPIFKQQKTWINYREYPTSQWIKSSRTQKKLLFLISTIVNRLSDEWTKISTIFSLHIIWKYICENDYKREKWKKKNRKFMMRWEGDCVCRRFRDRKQLERKKSPYNTPTVGECIVKDLHERFSSVKSLSSSVS